MPHIWRAKVLQKMHIRKKSEQYMQKKDRFYLSHTVFITHSSSLENELMDSDDKVQPFFCTYCERAAVWAAFRDRTFGGIAKKQSFEFLTKTIVFLARRRPKVRTKKRTSARELRFFISFSTSRSHLSLFRFSV